jgi:hypothetical protein
MGSLSSHRLVSGANATAPAGDAQSFTSSASMALVLVRPTPASCILHHAITSAIWSDEPQASQTTLTLNPQILALIAGLTMQRSSVSLSSTSNTFIPDSGGRMGDSKAACRPKSQPFRGEGTVPRNISNRPPL